MAPPSSEASTSSSPTPVSTPWAATYRLFRPDLAKPTREQFDEASQTYNTLPAPYAHPVDIANAMSFLASDEARHITGVSLPVDADTVV